VRIFGFFGGWLALVAIFLTAEAGTLRPGEFFWEPELSPSGPLVIIISLPDQALSAYRNGIRIAYSSISSGTKGRRTPAGVFTILEKEVTHFSNKYHHAPMPYMQRLTWEGVALHGGDLPGYPASHGCIRLPHEFAKRLYSLTVRGTTVIVADEKSSRPTFAARPGILLTAQEGDISRSIEGGFEWNPQRSEEGPITILASGADKTVYVYRNGIPIGRAALKIDNPTQPLGGHAFTMLAGVTETASAFVPGRPGHQWMAVKTDSKKNDTTLDDLARRVHVSAEFAEKVYDIVMPGTTMVVTDAPALHPSPAGRAVLLMEAERK
jgi:hypothetical protein